MRWCLIYNAELPATAVVAEDGLEHYRLRGWRRVSEWFGDADDLKAAQVRGDLDLADDPVDLDAPDPAPAKKATAKHETKESS